MAKENPKAAFDEAIKNMTASASPFFRDYVFYMHLISQCRLNFDENLQAAAGVSFHHDRFTLHLNPKPVIAEGVDQKTGKHVQVQGFCMDMPIEHRIGILKHEMLHIILGYFKRVEDRTHKLFNIASDCALNQEINRKHLPDYAIYPDNILPDKSKKVALRETSEFYYELLEKEQKKQKKQKGEGEGEGQASKGTGSQSDGKGGNGGSGKGFEPMLDDHSLWDTNEGDPTLQQEFTKNMVEKAANATQKSRGNLPSNYGQIIENLTIKREVNWKQLLRRIVGNKKAHARKTLMRKDRRLPKANWLKGKTKDRVFELGVVSDVSGSVSDEALINLWGEILHICKLLDTAVNVVQIDTTPCPPMPLTATTKTVKRQRCGGTILAPAIEMFNEHRCHFDALVVTTDGYLCPTDIEPFEQLKKPVIWLIEKHGQIMPAMNNGLMRAVQLKGDKT